jgi:rod shape-determining protein MreC
MPSPLLPFRNMPELIRKYRLHIAAGVTLFAALIFFSLNLRHRGASNAVERGIVAAASPIHSGGASVGRFFDTLWHDYLFLIDIRKENRKLLETVKIQNERLALAAEAVQENGRLNALLEMKKSLAVPAVAASVIGEDNSPWFRTILINRGESDGIREGMPVVAVNGVVGQVVRVTAKSARVLLLTDHSSAVAAVVQRSRARGVIRGKSDGLCTLEFSAREDDIKVGDQVVTSGIGGLFPKGIPVGEVTMVKKGEFGIFQTVNIRPAVNIPRLEELLVLLQHRDD